MSPSPGGAAGQDPNLWRKFSQATRPAEFGEAWLMLQARMIGGVSAGLVTLGRTPAQASEPVAVWPADYPDVEGLQAAALRSFEQRKGVVNRADLDDPDSEDLVLAYPVLVDDTCHGGVALRVASRSQVELHAAMRQLQWGIAWLHNWMLRAAAHGKGAAGGGSLATVLDIVGVALESQRFRSAATGAATELASRLDCDRVSIGFHKRGRVRVHAVSHSAEFRKQMNLIRAIETAMAESVDQHAMLVYPEATEGGKHVVRAHKDLARVHGDGVVCTVPFENHEGKAIGAITFERSVETTFDATTLKVCDSATAVLGPILDEKRHNDRWLIVKLRDSLWTQVQRLVGPRHAVRKLVAVVAVILVLFLSVARGSYRITSEATLEGEVRRAITAPFPGFISEASARGGDVVEEGQALCKLDVRDLRLEYSRWSTEREQYVVEHRRAMAEGDRAAMNILNNKMDQAEARIALLDDQIERANIVAPFGGVVVSGDLSQSLGAPVETGQVLFEVAPLESYRVMLRVDERDIDEISEGQRGELILTSMPDTRYAFSVSKITPISEVEEGRTYFSVEGMLDQAPDRLRPGMEGFSKVDVDRRRLIWIWTHDLVDWFRVKLWTWLP